jgi:hypothetical protein
MILKNYVKQAVFPAALQVKQEESQASHTLVEELPKNPELQVAAQVLFYKYIPVLQDVHLLFKSTQFLQGATQLKH